MPRSKTLRISHLSGCSLATLLLSAACGFMPVSPTSTGAEVLENTQGAVRQQGRAFTISPDGRWLLFSLGLDMSQEFEDLTEVGRQQLDAHRLYDLWTRQAIPIRRTPEVDEWLELVEVFLPDGGCWAQAPLRVFVRDPTSGGAEVEPYSEPPTWTLVPARQAPCRSPDFASVQRDTVLGAFHVGWEGKDLVIRGRRKPDRIYARYGPIPLIGSRVAVSELALSGDGRALAYAVDRPLGSFVGNDAGFFITEDSDSGPRSLATPISTLRWGPEGWLYAQAEVVGGSDPVQGIVRWKLRAD